MSFAQDISDQLWSQITEYAQTEIQDKAILKHVYEIRENSKRISDNPTIDHSKYIDQIQINVNELQPKLIYIRNHKKVKLLKDLKQALFYETVSSLLLGKTSESEKNKYFTMMSLNMNSVLKDKISINDMGFSSLVISEESKNYLTTKVQTNINNLVAVETIPGELQATGFGGAVLESSNGEEILVPIKVGQSVKDENDNLISYFAGQVLGQKLDITQNYHVKKIVVIFENEEGEFFYNTKSIQKDPTLTLKPIDTGLVDFITNSEYAISFDKFQEAVNKGNVIPFDDGGNFIVRGGEHSLGVIIWREEQLFAFYRCHNDNYAEKIINAENCWIIKAPRSSLPAGFERSPYMYYGVYKIINISDSFTNLDYMLNRVTYKLNHGQGLMYEYTGKIYANGNKQLEAIRNTRDYNNLLSKLYDSHASFFEDVMKYTYYFGVGTGVGAVIDKVIKKIIYRKTPHKPDSRFKLKQPGAFGKFSLTSLYQVSLKYGAVVFGGTAVLYGVNKSMKELDIYMRDREFSLDHVLAMKEEMRRVEGEKEYYIEANRNLINVIHAAIIDVLKNYNAREKKEALKISKEECEKVYQINCTEEMIRGLYPEGA